MKTTSLQNNQKTIGTMLHVLTFGKWVFPFGNLILPIILWSANSRKSEFIDHHGRQVINFQISMTLYAVLLLVIGFTIIGTTFLSGGAALINRLETVNGFPFSQDMGTFSVLIGTGITISVLCIGLSIIDTIYSIKGAYAASNGDTFNYPLSISFLKDEKDTNSESL